jgi:integrase
MSVKWNPKRGKYEVRWLEGGRHPSKLFDRKGDADAFDLEKKRQRQLGALAPTVMRSRITLAEFMAGDWWPRYAIPNLAEDTRRRYLEVWGTHLLPRLGDYELRAITPWLVEDFRADLERVKVGAPTVRKAMMLLQGILRRAVVRGLIASNPVQSVGKPKQPPAPPPQPLAPEAVERIRAHMMTAWSSPSRGSGRSPEQLAWWRARNATIVSLLAYGGLRPVEDRGSCWADVQDRTLHVVASKTGRARDINLVALLAQDLGAVAAAVRPSARQGADLPDRRRGRVEAPRLAELAPKGLPARGDRRRRHRGSAPLPAARQLCVAAVVGGPVADLCRRAGRPFGRDAGPPLRGCAARARARAAHAGG